MNYLDRIAELIQQATACTEEQAILAAHDICDELQVDRYERVE